METFAISKVVKCLAETESLEDIMSVMKSSFAKIGFNEWVYACQFLRSYVNAPVFVFMNTSREWVERYLEMGYHQFDPIAHYYINNDLPWIWRADDNWIKFGNNAADFMQDLRRYGYTGGLCIPLFSAQNTRGFINFVVRTESLDDLYAALEVRAAQAMLLMRYVQGEIFRIARNDDEEFFCNPLTPREAEVLLWVGEGLTAKGIADKLGISFRTIEHHIMVIQRKLSVSNRQQAVTRAVSLGFILPLNMYNAPRDPSVRLIL